MNEVLDYITGAPYFWQSMGAIVACAMFVGSIIYNGDYARFYRGLITISTYAVLLTTITLTRIIDVEKRGEIINYKLAYSGTATIFIVTIFYVLGLYLGVAITNYAHRQKNTNY